MDSPVIYPGEDVKIPYLIMVGVFGAVSIYSQKPRRFV
ncbi:hypothetical protein M595_4892 [Lyngbya aestuarii BL J]|uniref:Uncharacterized protein n=1 Tax=Lyngbya aestuarii BL J TaxID=1348334 RepID=U7QBB5_9CYAN|nr:hypothetical protein M595_4892 [Lyngbya aestuarii BL J]